MFGFGLQLFAGFVAGAEVGQPFLQRGELGCQFGCPIQQLCPTQGVRGFGSHWTVK
jgi:hypothetical protein